MCVCVCVCVLFSFLDLVGLLKPEPLIEKAAKTLSLKHFYKYSSIYTTMVLISP